MPMTLPGRPTGRALVALIASALATLAGARPTPAQTLLEPPRRRQGYYLSLGLASAIDHNWQDGESLGTSRGQLFDLRAGELLTRRFGLGLHIDAGGTTKGTRRATLFDLGIEAQWELATNLAAHGSVGLGVVSLEDTSDPDAKRKGTAGAGYTVWLTYDWFFGHRRSGGWALSPLAGVHLVPGSSATALVGLVGLSITYWTGLPREQLQLAPNEAW
jgi:hypothetical protein